MLDSNILFSALISTSGPPRGIYQAWQDKRFDIVTAHVQLDELRRASRQPKFHGVLQPRRVGRLLNNPAAGLVVEPLRVDDEAADPDDSWLLALAVAGRADYLVTGDKRSGLLARVRVGASIPTAASFCKALD